MFIDLTKDQIIEKIADLKSQAFEFSNNQDPQAVFAAFIVNIGY